MKILLNGEGVETTPSDTPTLAQSTADESANIKSQETSTFVRSGHNSFRLEQLAYLRSGDKGNIANIGIIILMYCSSPAHSQSMQV